MYKTMQTASGNNTFNFICCFCHLDSLPLPEGLETHTQEEIKFNIPENLNGISQEVKNLKGMKIAHLNINGLRSKLDYVKILFSELDVDVVSVVSVLFVLPLVFVVFHVIVAAV